MHRRHFFTTHVRSLTTTFRQRDDSSDARRDLNVVVATDEALAADAPADLSPYIPRGEKPWNIRRARHLLSRIGFGVRWAQLDAALSSSPATIVDTALSANDVPDSPFFWTTLPPISENVDKEERALTYGPWTRLLQFWWMRTMTEERTMLREKMTLFWHNHFVSDIAKVEVPQYMFSQNQLFRRHAFGSFKDLTREISTDPAMLVYLDGATNTKGNPNENYARELLELFTLGAGEYSTGRSHYTEQDIIDLARALTGWTVDALTSRHDPDRFDASSKTIFNETGDFGIAGSGSKDVVDLIFSQEDPDAGTYRAAVHICTKLYRAFVYDIPDMDIVKGMAQTLQTHDWDIGATLRQLLLSEHFFEDNVIGGQIKSPVEMVVGSIRELGLDFPENPDPGDPEVHDPLSAATYLAQQLLYPPNVKGWPGGQSWITMATLPLRARYLSLWISPMTGSLEYGFNPVAFVNTLSNPKDVHAALDDMISMLLPIDISDASRNALLDVLLGGGNDADWRAEDAVEHIRECLVRICDYGEYQLA